MISPGITAVVIATLAALAFGGGFALADWRSAARIQRLSANNETLSKKVAASEITHAGYGYIDPIWGWPQHSQDSLEKARTEVEKKNAQKFIDDRSERVELIEIFYRKVK